MQPTPQYRADKYRHSGRRPHQPLRWPQKRPMGRVSQPTMVAAIERHCQAARAVAIRSMRERMGLQGAVHLAVRTVSDIAQLMAIRARRRAGARLEHRVLSANPPQLNDKLCDNPPLV
jgi:hypothetical protein